MNKRIIFIIFTIIFSSILMLLVCEGVYRLFFLNNDKSWSYNIYERDSDIGYRLKNNIFKKTISEGNKIIIQTNDKHLRDKKRFYENKSGKKRIVMLGDSFTFGVGINMEKSFSWQLEKLFTQNGMNFEVINGGISGQSNLQQFYWLKKELIKYNFDIVVLNFFANDVYENVKPFSTIENKSLVFIAEIGNKSKKKSSENVINKFKKNFMLLDFLMEKLKNAPLIRRIATKLGFLDSVFPVDFNLLLKKPGKKTLKAIESTWKILKELRDYCKERNIKLYVAYQPPAYITNDIVFNNLIQQYNMDLSKIDRFKFVHSLENFLKNNDIEYIDVLMPIYQFQQTHPDVKMYNCKNNNGHTNVKSHELIAKLMFDFFKNKQ